MDKDISYWFTKEGIKEFLEIKRQEYLQKLGDEKPVLQVIHQNSDPRSNIYVNNKMKRAKDFNIICKKVRLFGDDYDPTGFTMVQSPIEPTEEQQIILHNKKDPKEIFLRASRCGFSVEGFCPGAAYDQLYKPQEATWPCTARGIYEHAMFVSKMYNDSLEGELAVIIGRSDLVGKPVAKMFESLANMTVVQCHSKTPSWILRSLLKTAKVVVVAVGKRKFLKLYKYVTSLDAYIYDVGINVNQQGKVVGDVYSDESRDFMITPVPGGVGKLTVDALMWNTIDEHLEMISWYRKQYQDQMNE